MVDSLAKSFPKLQPSRLMREYFIFSRLWVRFRYPVSLPEDVANALGMPISNSLSYHDFIDYLTHLTQTPTRLAKYMPRELAEEAFQTALRKEKFCNSSLFSYYFNDGWMEFVLQFDDQSRLRRVYIQHKDIIQDEGVEIPLAHFGS